MTTSGLQSKEMRLQFKEVSNDDAGGKEGTRFWQGVCRFREWQGDAPRITMAGHHSLATHSPTHTALPSTSRTVLKVLLPGRGDSCCSSFFYKPIAIKFITVPITIPTPPRALRDVDWVMSRQFPIQSLTTLKPQQTTSDVALAIEKHGHCHHI